MTCDSLQFLQDFLKEYNIPQDVTLSNAPWKQFFVKVVNQFQTARLHFFLSDFLQAIGQRYSEDGRSVEFIIDVLNLKVDKLLSGE